MMPSGPRRSVASPFGPVTLHQVGGLITRLSWGGTANDPSALLDDAARQLSAYFNGTLRSFDLPLEWGSGLNEKTRRAMAAIPMGETRTYGDLARALSAPAQAIGQACGANPIPILIPCHRILGASSLGGYSAPGGIETKIALLRHEGAAGLLI